LTAKRVYRHADLSPITIISYGRISPPLAINPHGDKPAWRSITNQLTTYIVWRTIQNKLMHCYGSAFPGLQRFSRQLAY